MHPSIPPPSPRHILLPLLDSLPAATVSSQPPTALLPILSPILRQRVQLLSASTSEPWLPLLCYDHTKASRLSEIVQSARFEAHPVSGEVEIDWDHDVETRYSRIDEETLYAFLLLQDFDLIIKLLWCVGDQEAGGDGWKIGEVSVLNISSASDKLPLGWESIGEAEVRFRQRKTKEATFSRTYDSPGPVQTVNGTNGHPQLVPKVEDEDDDDAYWDRYDSTPAPTPAPKHSPAPASASNERKFQSDEDNYYAQYASVQPALDNHDPDEASQNGNVESTLGHQDISHDFLDSSRSWSEEPRDNHVPLHQPQPQSSSINGEEEMESPIAQPRPASSNSSSGEETVARLENTAAAQVQSEFGIKQHISTSVKSLFRLARTAGMDRGEFERLVRTELDVLGLMEEDD